MKPLTRADMYKKEKNGKKICILPIAIPKKYQDRSKYSPAITKER